MYKPHFLILAIVVPDPIQKLAKRNGYTSVVPCMPLNSAAFRWLWTCSTYARTGNASPYYVFIKGNAETLQQVGKSKPV